MLRRIIQCCVQINLFYILLLPAFVQCEGLSGHISLKTQGNGMHRLDAEDIYLEPSVSINFLSFIEKCLKSFIYQVDFSDFIQQCYVAIYLQLPPALYVNVNELSNLRRLGTTTACSIGETDIELFTDNAQAQNVTICSPLSHSNCTLKFPVHQRYQYANANFEYVNISLPKPKLLLGCKERIREYRVSKLDLCSPCVELVAKWREIPYIMDIGDVWTTPVGDTAMLNVVTYTTLLITSLCTVFLIWTICKSMPKQHSKAE